MLLHRLSALLLLMGLGSPLPARELLGELELVHIGGLLTPAELETLLADPRLRIEAHYQPTRLIAGETARRERVLPLGSRLFAIARQTDLGGDAVAREGRRLRWRAPDALPDSAHYRLQSLLLRVPLPSGLGRPQPDLTIGLMEEPPPPAGLETAKLGSHLAFELGWVLRLRWSDGPAPSRAGAPLNCPPDVMWPAGGPPRFRPRHPAAGLSTFMTSQRGGSRLRNPLPGDLTGWTWHSPQLVRASVGPWSLEHLALNGEQQGPGECRRVRNHSGLLVNGQPVLLKRTVTETACSGPDDSRSETTVAEWLDNGQLASLLRSSHAGSWHWDGFGAQEPRCGPWPAAPTPDETRALGAELLRLRDAFERP